MKFTRTVKPGFVIEAEAADPKEMFRRIATLDEIFGIHECGNCKSENLKFVHRTANRKDNGAACEYYSIKCRDCHHEFKFGQKQAAGQPLFPKGWEAPYQGDGGGGESYSQEPQYAYEQESYQASPPPHQQQRQAAPAAAGPIPW